jgi:hypothetical protein
MFRVKLAGMLVSVKERIWAPVDRLKTTTLQNKKKRKTKEKKRKKRRGGAGGGKDSYDTMRRSANLDPHTAGHSFYRGYERNTAGVADQLAVLVVVRAAALVDADASPEQNAVGRVVHDAVGIQREGHYHDEKKKEKEGKKGEKGSACQLERPKNENNNKNKSKMKKITEAQKHIPWPRFENWLPSSCCFW